VEGYLVGRYVCMSWWCLWFYSVWQLLSHCNFVFAFAACNPQCCLLEYVLLCFQARDCRCDQNCHRHKENLWAQAKAWMPASFIHFTIWQLADIPHAISSSLQLCHEIIYNVLILPKCIQSCFKSIRSVSRYSPVRRATPRINHPVREIKCLWCGNFVLYYS